MTVFSRFPSLSSFFNYGLALRLTLLNDGAITVVGFTHSYASPNGGRHERQLRQRMQEMRGCTMPAENRYFFMLVLRKFNDDIERTWKAAVPCATLPAAARTEAWSWRKGTDNLKRG